MGEQSITPQTSEVLETSEVLNSFKETEIGPIPVEWEVVPLHELAHGFFSGGTPSTKRPEFWNGDIPWTTSAHIDGLYLKRGAKYITSQGLKRSASKVVPRGNLLIGTRVGVGKVAITSIDVAISQDLTGAIVDRNKAYPEFLAYAIQTDDVQKLIRLSTRGTTIKGIPRKDLVQIPTPLPPLEEQRRIAHVLSTIQRAIAAQDALITAARELKHSLMQHLFTYGPVPLDQADQVPLKETEIGPVPEHWEAVWLGEVVRATQYGLSLRADQTGKYPMLRMNNLIDGRVDTAGLKYVDLDKNDFAKFRVQKRDVLFNRTNSYELVGKTAIFDLEGNFVFASYLIRVVPDVTQLRPEYLNHYLNWDDAQRRLRMLATRGVSQSNISATKLKRLAIGLPPLAEQQEIVRELSAVDRKVEAEERRKAALQALFKTMLHQLMTGEVRVRELVEVP